MTDLDLARQAAASYDAKPAGACYDWRDCRAVVTGRVAAIRGTVPGNWANWLRDLRINGEVCKQHPRFGPCPAGALTAAEALSESLPDVDAITGHSLGGQIATLVAAMRDIPLLVTWDAPKAGGDGLRETLSHSDVRQFRFRGSVVTCWPLFLDEHVRPLTEIGDWTPLVVEAHSISRAVSWMARHGNGC